MLLRYTSLQSYKILLEYFPLLSLSLLAKLKSSSVDSIKAAQVLRENKAISEDIILMADEMYLRKKVQYSGGEYVGADKDKNLYKGIVVFMVCGLKKNFAHCCQNFPRNQPEWDMDVGTTGGMRLYIS